MTFKLNRTVWFNIIKYHTITLMFLTFTAEAANKVFTLEINNHLFTPTVLHVPADTKVKLIIINHDKTPEEFESFSLNREKVILGNAKGTVYIGPLEPGEYSFFGEYNPDSAKGVIIVVPADQWQEVPDAH